MATTKFILAESEIPTQWYNIAADLPSPLPPPLHPGTHQPIGPDEVPRKRTQSFRYLVRQLTGLQGVLQGDLCIARE